MPEKDARSSAGVAWSVDFRILSSEPSQTMPAAYVDFKKKFSSLHQETLWVLPRLRGISVMAIDLVTGLRLLDRELCNVERVCPDSS